jgi:dienelactone hydrolase
MKEDDIPSLVVDVRAAIGFAMEQSEGKAPGVVLVGSSLGAALVAAAAGQEPKVTALALVSPGARIEGFDVYHPFADVRTLPSLLVCAKEDNVCKAPIDSLGQMGKEHATTKIYDGGGHGALGLLGKTPLGDDLEQWLVSVYDEKPTERRLREPPPPDAKKKRRKAKGKGK